MAVQTEKPSSLNDSEESQAVEMRRESDSHNKISKKNREYENLLDQSQKLGLFCAKEVAMWKKAHADTQNNDSVKSHVKKQAAEGMIKMLKEKYLKSGEKVVKDFHARNEIFKTFPGGVPLRVLRNADFNFAIFKEKNFKEKEIHLKDMDTKIKRELVSLLGDTSAYFADTDAKKYIKEFESKKDVKAKLQFLAQLCLINVEKKKSVEAMKQEALELTLQKYPRKGLQKYLEIKSLVKDDLYKELGLEAEEDLIRQKLEKVENLKQEATDNETNEDYEEAYKICKSILTIEDDPAIKTKSVSLLRQIQQSKRSSGLTQTIREDDTTTLESSDEMLADKVAEGLKNNKEFGKLTEIAQIVTEMGKQAQKKGYAIDNEQRKTIEEKQELENAVPPPTQKNATDYREHKTDAVSVDLADVKEGELTKEQLEQITINLKNENLDEANLQIIHSRKSTSEQHMNIKEAGEETMDIFSEIVGKETDKAQKKLKIKEKPKIDANSLQNKIAAMRHFRRIERNG